MDAKPVPGGAVIGAGVGDEAPVDRGMIHAAQMHQLVDEHVVPRPGRHQHQAPIEADVSASAAGSPARALVPDADASNHKAVLSGEFVQARWQFTDGSFANHEVILGDTPLLWQPRALPRNPRCLCLSETLGVSPRPAARNRDAHTAIGVDSQEVAPRPPMAHVVHRAD